MGPMGRMGRRVGVGLGALALLGLTACDPPPPPVATFVVDTAVDAPDASPGDGTCAIAGGGCSLRAAMREAHLAYWESEPSAMSALPLVQIAAGVDPVLSSQLPTAGGMTIRGGGATIDANGVSSPFLACQASLRIEDVTITGAGPSGGAIYEPDCSVPRLQVHRVTFTGNAGWAVYADDADTSVSDTTITDGGGGIWADTELTVSGTTITDTTGYGISQFAFRSTIVTTTVSRTRGVSLQGETSLVLGSTFTSNGGSIHVGDWGQSSILHSTIADNTGGVGLDGTVAISASTISGNGGGIFADDGDVVISASTVVDNGTTGQISEGARRLVLRGSIFGGTGGACPPDDEELFGYVDVISEGWNIVTDDSCGLTGPGDQEGVDPLLLPLADVGGLTPVRQPAVGSPAIDAIPVGTPVLCSGDLQDQILVARPQGAGCDIGAMEQSGV